MPLVVSDTDDKHVKSRKRTRGIATIDKTITFSAGILQSRKENNEYSKEIKIMKSYPLNSITSATSADDDLTGVWSC